MSITTSTGTTISTAPSEHGPLIILDHPDAPNDMRLREVGRIVDGGFQPEPFAIWTVSPETLRGIADLIDAAHQAANEPARPTLHAVPDTEPGDAE